MHGCEEEENRVSDGMADPDPYIQQVIYSSMLDSIMIIHKTVFFRKSKSSPKMRRSGTVTGDKLYNYEKNIYFILFCVNA